MNLIEIELDLTQDIDEIEERIDIVLSDYEGYEILSLDYYKKSRRAVLKVNK